MWGPSAAARFARLKSRINLDEQDLARQCKARFLALEADVRYVKGDLDKLLVRYTAREFRCHCCGACCMAGLLNTGCLHPSPCAQPLCFACVS